MRGYGLAIFALLFVDCGFFWWSFGRLREALADRHPDNLRAFEKSSRLPFRGLWNSLWDGKLKGLNDTLVDKLCLRLKVTYGVMLALWVAYLVALANDPIFQHQS